MPVVAASFADPEHAVRWSAIEAMYNIVKVTRHETEILLWSPTAFIDNRLTLARTLRYVGGGFFLTLNGCLMHYVS